jgi:hypothetical protein
VIYYYYYYYYFYIITPIFTLQSSSFASCREKRSRPPSVAHPDQHYGQRPPHVTQTFVMGLYEDEPDSRFVQAYRVGFKDHCQSNLDATDLVLTWPPY